MDAQTLITRALKLVNVPGRGAVLSPEELADGFDTLLELLDSESVSKQFTPGITKHFFDLTAGKAIYTYGPAGDLDTNRFEDAVPSSIEQGYVRVGATITDNETVADYDFSSSAGWTTLTGGWSIANGVATAAGSGACGQAITVTPGATYVLRLELTVEAGDVVLTVDESGPTTILSQTLTESGAYEYEIIPSEATLTLTLTTGSAGDDLQVDEFSVLPLGADRYALPDGIGTDYPIKLVDQTRYNRLQSKGQGGRPYRILFSRAYPLATLYCDRGALAGDILVLDVLVNRTRVSELTSTIHLHGSSLRYVRYKLADELSGEYGKSLSLRQLRLMREAYESMATGTRRRNRLRVDRGLMSRRASFHIDGGDDR